MVVLMSSWYYEKKDLKRSPSLLDGLDVERESRYRREGARFIINVGTKMGLRYDTMATGVVYFHRFYMFHSFKTFPRYVTACCCLFLAGKVEETPKKCKDIIKIAKSFLGDSQFAQFGDDPKEEVMTLERILLQTIKFDLQVDHPYGHLLKYAKCLKGDKVKLQNMVQMAWTFINDSLCTTLCLQWEPEVIAIALMYLAGKLSKFEVVDWVTRNSRHSHWWDMFIEGMSVELLEDICHQVLDLYSTPNPNTPQDSPPATPPTKSTRKPTSQPPSPVELCASPILTKPKEAPVPVGQPIPRLEPGELKRKVTQQTEFRKETAEAKVPRPLPVMEGKAIPTITTTSGNSSPNKALSSQGSDTQPSSPSTPVESTKSTSSDVVFHSNIVSMSQPYSQQTASFLPSAKSTPAKAMPPMPIASFSAAPPAAPTVPYAPPANQYFAPSMGNDYTVSQPPPPPQAFPQRYQHPPPAPPPIPPPAMPQYPEPPQYNTMPPSGGGMPPFGSQYPPPPRPLPPPPPQQPPPPPQGIRPLLPPMPPPPSHHAPPLPHDPYRPHMEPYMDTRRPPEPPLPPQHHPMRPNPYDYDGGGDRRFRGQRDEFEMPYNPHQQPPRHHHQEAPRPPFEYDEGYNQPYRGEYDSPGRMMPQGPRPFRMEHRKPLPPHDRMPPQNPGASTGIAPVRVTGSNS